MTQTKIKRAVIYTRISLSDDESTSIIRQRKDLIERADREGWTIVAEFSDDGISGAKTRENAQAALKMLSDGSAEILACWKFDRWSRMGLSAVANLIDVLDANPGTEFHALQDGLSSTQPAWRIIAAVLAEVARIERENIQTRVKSSLKELRTNGRFAGGQITYGYVSAPNPDGPGRILIPNPAEVAVITETAERVIKGESTYSICRDFNARGITARNGGQWTVASMQKILREETLLGRVKVNGKILRDADGMPEQVWEPIVTFDLWNRVQSAMGRKPLGQQRRKRTRILSGIVYCAECDSRMIPKVAGSGTISYICPSKAKGKICPGVSILADELDKLIVDKIILNEANANSPWLERVETPLAAVELAEVESAINTLSDEMRLPGVNRMRIAEQLDKLDARRAELEMSDETRVEWVDSGMTIGEKWESAELPERQQLLSLAIKRIQIGKGGRAKAGTIDESRIKIEWALAAFN